ncbi:snurportin-1 isoform X2 [Lycorma delicatula]|uniref:snurportin-1 isoform X2 n=1 Tax=Lycorma delicatula TaxID=130591 RepID=UPI003F50EB0B
MADGGLDVIKTELDPISDLFSSTLRTDDTSLRVSQYKCRVRNESNQEARRRQLLERQKEKRSIKFNERRSVKDKNGGGWSEEVYIERCSQMKVAWHKKNRLYKNMIMFSEWLIDIPSNFTDNWIMVPCPDGKRSIIVSEMNQTISYTKKGIPTRHFKTLLPPKTVLDCIWNSKTESFYVLDVIQWNGMSLKNCQADFRFYWLNTKFQENPHYSIKTNENIYPSIALQRYSCNFNVISKTLENYPFFLGDCPKLDGLLFFHSETHYTSGYTPLVGWLKPYMLPEVFDVKINPEYNAKKPDGYVSFTHYLNEKEVRRQENRESKKNLHKIKR